MATVLAYTSPARGNLYPIVALLIELQRRGHRIVLRTLAAGVSTARQLEFEASAIDQRIEAAVMTDWMARNTRTALKVAFGVFGHRAALEIEDVRAVIASQHPDVLLVDANCWGQRRWRMPVLCRGRRFGRSHPSCDRAAYRLSGRVCDRGPGSSVGYATRRFAHS
jgi:hypothetical protein